MMLMMMMPTDAKADHSRCFCFLCFAVSFYLRQAKADLPPPSLCSGVRPEPVVATKLVGRAIVEVATLLHGTIAWLGVKSHVDIVANVRNEAKVVASPRIGPGFGEALAAHSGTGPGDGGRAVVTTTERREVVTLVLAGVGTVRVTGPRLEAARPGTGAVVSLISALSAADTSISVENLDNTLCECLAGRIVSEEARVGVALGQAAEGVSQKLLKC